MAAYISRGQHNTVIYDDDLAKAVFEPRVLPLGRVVDANDVVSIEGGLDLVAMDGWISLAVTEVNAWLATQTFKR